MVNGLSAAVSGMQANAARFERAASQVANAAAEDAASPEPELGPYISSALSHEEVEMVVARFGFTAALRAASTTSDMLLDAIRMGGYAA